MARPLRIFIVIAGIVIAGIVIAGMGLAHLASQPLYAEPLATVSLQYHRDASAASCPDEPALRKGVAARLGREAFRALLPEAARKYLGAGLRVGGSTEPASTIGLSAHYKQRGPTLAWAIEGRLDLPSSTDFAETACAGWACKAATWKIWCTIPSWW